jgi:hypothetical protein
MSSRGCRCSDSIVRLTDRTSRKSVTAMDHLAPTKRLRVRPAPRLHRSPRRQSTCHPSRREATTARHPARPGQLSRLLPRPIFKGDRQGPQADGSRVARRLPPPSPALRTRAHARCVDRMARGAADSPCGIHEIRFGSDDAVSGQRFTCGQTPRRKPARAPVTVVMLVRPLDNRLPYEDRRTDRSSRLHHICPDSDRFAGVQCHESRPKSGPSRLY